MRKCCLPSCRDCSSAGPRPLAQSAVDLTFTFHWQSVTGTNSRTGISDIQPTSVFLADEFPLRPRSPAAVGLRNSVRTRFCCKIQRGASSKGCNLNFAERPSKLWGRLA